MIRLFRENVEFGEYSMFDTENGILKEITANQYDELAQKTFYTDIFQGNSVTHTVFPRRIYFQITRRCNLLCPYCFIKADNKQKDLPLDAIMNIIPYLGKMGLMEIRLTGGEPTLHKDFKTIVKAFRDNKIYVSVATNGMWSREILDFFCESPDLWLIISIDGNEETHNKYRYNTYQKIVRNLKILREKNPNIRIRFNTVLTKETIETLEESFALANKLAVESITFIPLRPQVRDAQIREKMISSEDFMHAFEHMVLLKNKYKVKFTTSIETIYKKEVIKDKVFKKRSSCAAGREGMNLDYDYNNKRFIVYGCSYSPASDLEADQKIRAPFLAGTFSFGKAEELFDIWSDDKCWEIYRKMEYKSLECRTCSYYKIACAGSCPIQNIDYSKLDVKKDVIKQLQWQMQRNGEWYCYKNFIKK